MSAGGCERPLNLPWQTFESADAIVLGAACRATVATRGPTRRRRAVGGERFPPALSVAAATATPARGQFAFVEPQFDGDAEQFPLHFLPYPSSAFLDGSLAHLPWLQEMPDPLTSAMWSSWVEINPATAATLGIHEGDIVEVASSHGDAPDGRDRFAGHCARPRGDAGRAGTSDVHALRERQRREPAALLRR